MTAVVGTADPLATSSDDERARLLRAAWRVLERAGYENVKVKLVADEARLSVRAFYRHFSGKDDLLFALLGAELERATAILDELTATGTPEARVAAWVEGVVSLPYGRRAGPRARLFTRLGAVLADMGTPKLSDGTDADIAAPLERAIADGCRAGSFPGADPAGDAAMILALCCRLDEVPGQALPADREQGVAMVQDFVLRALRGTAR